ncbi:hypothetical protein GQ44DRAFT_774016 [Phaeosphaeriaceae sp. PMI808]|nr:hypothetical protein GQ44DRAFT_774016 [Phaeosphaeriaceae sp. PMI808]
MKSELIGLLDEHLAWQAESEERELQRRGSTGTLLVDWDGVGDIKVSYRKQPGPATSPSTTHQSSRAPRQKHHPYQTEQPQLHFQSQTRSSKAKTRALHHQPYTSKPLPPAPSIKTAHRTQTRTTHTRVKASLQQRLSMLTHHHTSASTSSLSIRYDPSTNTIAGHDARTGFSYDYNGRIVHVHRDAGRESAVSEYHYADIVRRVPVAMSQKSRNEGTASRQGRHRSTASRQSRSGTSSKREKVVGFVKRLLRKLDGVGALDQLGG